MQSINEQPATLDYTTPARCGTAYAYTSLSSCIQAALRTLFFVLERLQTEDSVQCHDLENAMSSVAISAKHGQAGYLNSFLLHQLTSVRILHGWAPLFASCPGHEGCGEALAQLGLDARLHAEEQEAVLAPQSQEEEHRADAKHDRQRH